MTESVTLSVAERTPSTVGEKVTPMVQDACGATVLPLAGQVFVWLKSLAFAPVRAMLLILNGCVPVFVSFTELCVLLTP